MSDIRATVVCGSTSFEVMDDESLRVSMRRPPLHDLRDPTGWGFILDEAERAALRQLDLAKGVPPSPGGLQRRVAMLLHDAMGVSPQTMEPVLSEADALSLAGEVLVLVLAADVAP